MSSRIMRLVFGSPGTKDLSSSDPYVNDLSGSDTQHSGVLSELKYTFLSDEELTEELQHGNPDALTHLFARHSSRLFGIVRRILRNDAEAKDTVQQIFLDVFRLIQQFDPRKGDFRTWLLMITYHRSFNRRRHLSSIGFFSTDQMDELLPDLISGTKHIMGYSPVEAALLVRQILKTLQPRQQRTIELVFYEGLTAEEISARTGETVRVVRHNLYRGLAKLRRTLCPTKEGSNE